VQLGRTTGAYFEQVLPYTDLAVCAAPEEGFHIDLDDFLMGVISVANELVRQLLHNPVTYMTFTQPGIAINSLPT